MPRALNVIAVVVATVWIAHPQSTPEKQVTENHAGRNTTETTKPEESKGATNVTVVVKQEHPPEHNPSEGAEDENIKIQRELAYLTRWIVGIGFVQTLIFGFTVLFIHLQTSATKQSQRAWIV